MEKWNKGKEDEANMLTTIVATVLIASLSLLATRKKRKV